MGLFSIFKTGIDNDRLSNLLKEGALIIDVRTIEEYATGHIVGFVNIPLRTISAMMEQLILKNRPMITCCKSGARSKMAADQLRSAGMNVENGGPWSSLKGFM